MKSFITRINAIEKAAKGLGADDLPCMAIRVRRDEYHVGEAIMTEAEFAEYCAGFPDDLPVLVIGLSGFDYDETPDVCADDIVQERISAAIPA